MKRARRWALVSSGAAATAVVASGLFWGRDSPEASAASPGCVVASWHGGMLTLAEVDELRAAVSPAPSDAHRWAVDVALAAWDLGRAEASPAERVRAYRDWTAGKVGRRPAAMEARELARSLTELRERADLELGPCYRKEVTK